MFAISAKTKIQIALAAVLCCIGALVYLGVPAGPERDGDDVTGNASQPVKTAAVQQSADVKPSGTQTVEKTRGDTPHSADCAHCATSIDAADHSANKSGAPVLTTQPRYDSIFKEVARNGVNISRSDFDFLAGSRVGQVVELELADRKFTGEVAVVREGSRARAYVVDFDTGNLNVTVNRIGEFKAHYLFEGDSRVVELAESEAVSDTQSAVGGLLAREVTLSDVLCAPKGAVFPLTAPQPVPLSGLVEEGSVVYEQPNEVMAAISLTNDSTSEHVFFLNFEGETVTGDPWNVNSGVATIEALPAPRAGDDEYVRAIFERVVEDLAPFDIKITTDRSLYDATATENRLQAIITPTKDAAPSAGGVAFLNSYASDLSDIVWVFNLTEYAAATTISHEAGHAFGLRHDGTSLIEYYGGHNESYAPGWGPIMGATFFGGNKEVDQWSIGEYDDANNNQDDVAIIANAANGFGFKDDDYADVFTGGAGANVGALEDAGPDQAIGAGIIANSADKDVFGFSAAFSGLISIRVSPVDVEGGDPTRGANLAVGTRILDSAGNEVATGLNIGLADLGSLVEATLDAGVYYLEVDGIGRGDDPDTGFSDYGSIGQYTIDANLPTQPLKITSSPLGGKLGETILLGDTSTKISNGTDFGQSYPSNSQITHTYLLKNNGLDDLLNVVVSLSDGSDFSIVSAPPATIPAGAIVEMRIAYDPLQTGVNGVDADTVSISYDTSEPIVFNFSISGLSTPSANSDNYEPNNTYLKATNLNTVEDVWLSDYKGKAFFSPDTYGMFDFYTITAPADSLVEIDVLYDSTEEGLITFRAFNLINSTAFFLGTTTEEAGKIRIAVPETASLAQRKIYVEASHTGGGTVRNPYDLRYRITERGAGGDDFYEENDTREDAFDMTGFERPRLSALFGKGILKDEDWYKIEIPRDPFLRILYVRADFVHADGDINIDIIPDNDGSEREFTYGLAGEDEDYEVLTYFQNTSMADFAEEFTDGNTNIMGLTPGTYYIRVTGDYDAGNEYDLIIEAKQDDNYEIVDEVDLTENDSSANATPLGDAVINNWFSRIDGIGVIAGYAPTASAEDFQNREDRDWYTFSLPDEVLVGEMFIDFDNIIAESRIYTVYDANLQEIGGTENSDIEELEEALAGGTFSISNPVGQTFYISVLSEGSPATLAPYDFRVRLSNLPPNRDEVVDDNYEENDNFTQPFDLRDNANFWLSAKDGYGVNLDQDWFEISVSQNAEDLTIEAVFNGQLGELALFLSRKNGPVLFRGPFPAPEPEEPDPDADPDAEEEEPEVVNSTSIVWEDPEPGAYVITVLGQNQGNLYNLFWGYSLTEDKYEENDTLAQAVDLAGHEKKLLRKLDGIGVQSDEDWFRVTAGPGTDELKIISSFVHAEGDIDMELYNSAGRVSRSITTTDNEEITYLNPAAGDYFVRLYYGNGRNEYDLWWGAFTEAELDAMEPDAYETDNNQESATILPPFTRLDDLVNPSGPATQTDDDWWQLEIADSNSGFFVDCSFTHAEGDIDFEIIGPDGSVVIRADSQTDNEVVDYNGSVPGGIYYIRVYGANLGNEYDLFWVDYRDDQFEENDTFAKAADLEDFKQLRLSTEDSPTQGDDDWYRIVAEEAGSTLVLELTFDASKGDIDFEVYDSNETLLASDLSADELKYLQFALPTTGDFYIRVFGDDAYNEYDLFWNAVPDDGFEDNDIEADAHVISGDAGDDIVGVNLDDDWYEIDPPYGAVSVDLTFNFDSTLGDLNLEVFNQFGEPVVIFDSPTNTAAVNFEVDPFSGSTFVKISGVGNDYGNAYTLNWTSVIRDIDEDNDTWATATDLTFAEGIPLSEIFGYDTSGDEDWFRIQPTGTTLNVYCRFDHAEGDIDIELTDENGDFLLRAISDTDDEIITTAVTPGDTYYIRVFGETAGNPYDLLWNSYDGDDAFEDNDVFADAADIIAAEHEYREDLVQLDADWYEVEVEVGETLFVAELLPRSRIDEMVLELYDSGETLLESISTADGDNRIEADLLPAGLYYLKVSGNDFGGTYAVTWGSASEDNYEPNDDLASAYDITPIMSGILSDDSGDGAQFDEDWYSITLVDDSTLSADLDYFIDNEPLTMVLLDADEAFVGGVNATSAAGNVSLDVDGLTAGIYYFKIDGPNLGATYDLTWTTYADDAYEDNDSLDEPYDLGSAIAGTLSLIDGDGVRGADDDYFELQVPAGYVTLDVTCTFSDASGDIALEVFGGDKTSIGAVNTATDDELLSVEVNPRGESVYIKVSGAQDSAATYDLIWTFSKVDIYEEDDTSGTAVDITADEDDLLSESSGFRTQTDSDFYAVTLPAGSLTLNVDVFFTHDLGNIDVNVYDSVPVLIDSAVSTTDNETLATSVSSAGGVYYIEVVGDNSGNFYDLTWSVDVDDGYEENDDAANTADVSALNGARISTDLGLANQYDEDWFSFTTPVGAASLTVLIDEFFVTQGNIDLEVYDAADVLLASSADGTTFEQIQIPVDPAGQLIKVKVSGDNNGNTYDLVWTTNDDDLYEENDFVEEFYDLTASEGVWLSAVEGLATQRDDDWYQIVVSTGATTLTVEATFTHADGDIDLELYRLDPTADGEKLDPGLDQRKPTLISRSLTTTDNEEIVFDNTDSRFAPGIYFVRAYFDNQGNRYDLRWDDALVDTVGDDDFLDDGWVFGKNANAPVDARLLTPLANADGDNFPNWAEYALNLDVGVADTVVVDNSKQEIDGKTFFTISFVRSASAEDLGYQFIVEESSDLNFDGSRFAVQAGPAEDLGDGLERVTYRCNSDMTEAPNCFFMIRVEAPKSF